MVSACAEAASTDLSGTCKCRPVWDVQGFSACECSAGNETCVTPFGENMMKVCSEHGVCQSRCEEKHSGRWCEEECPDKCEQLKPCVQVGQVGGWHGKLHLHR